MQRDMFKAFDSGSFSKAESLNDLDEITIGGRAAMVISNDDDSKIIAIEYLDSSDSEMQEFTHSEFDTLMNKNSVMFEDGGSTYEIRNEGRELQYLGDALKRVAEEINRFQKSLEAYSEGDEIFTETDIYPSGIVLDNDIEEKIIYIEFDDGEMIELPYLEAAEKAYVNSLYKYDENLLEYVGLSPKEAVVKFKNNSKTKNLTVEEALGTPINFRESYYKNAAAPKEVIAVYKKHDEENRKFVKKAFPRTINGITERVFPSIYTGGARAVISDEWGKWGKDKKNDNGNSFAYMSFIFENEKEADEYIAKKGFILDTQDDLRKRNKRQEKEINKAYDMHYDNERNLKDGGALDKEFKFDKNFVIYVPSTTNVGSRIRPTDLQSRVNLVEKYVAEKFGGFTRTETDGGYKASSGDIIEEDIVKVSVFAKDFDWNQHEDEVVNKVKEWAKLWGQEAIGFEYEGDLYYIDEEGKFMDGGEIEESLPYTATFKDGGGVSPFERAAAKQEELINLRKKCKSKGIDIPNSDLKGLEKWEKMAAIQEEIFRRKKACSTYEEGGGIPMERIKYIREFDEQIAWNEMDVDEKVGYIKYLARVRNEYLDKYEDLVGDDEEYLNHQFMYGQNPKRIKREQENLEEEIKRYIIKYNEEFPNEFKGGNLVFSDFINKYAEGGKVGAYKIDEVLRHFVNAALWSSTNDEDEPLEDEYDFDDIPKEELEKLRGGIKKFIEDNEELLQKYNITDQAVGHDLFLDSQGHGVGFWDRGYDKADGDELSESASKIFASDSPYAQDGKVYFSNVKYAEGGEINDYNFGYVIKDEDGDVISESVFLMVGKNKEDAKKKAEKYIKDNKVDIIDSLESGLEEDEVSIEIVDTYAEGGIVIVKGIDKNGGEFYREFDSYEDALEEISQPHFNHLDRDSIRYYDENDKMIFAEGGKTKNKYDEWGSIKKYGDLQMSDEKTKKIAQDVANHFNNNRAETEWLKEGESFEVGMIEDGNFDLDIEDKMGFRDEGYGGSYTIMKNGDVVNYAVSFTPIVYNYKNKEFISYAEGGEVESLKSPIKTILSFRENISFEKGDSGDKAMDKIKNAKTKKSLLDAIDDLEGMYESDDEVGMAISEIKSKIGSTYAEGGNIGKYDPIKNRPVTYVLKNAEGKEVFKTKSGNKASDERVSRYFKGEETSITSIDSKGNTRELFKLQSEEKKYAEGGQVEMIEIAEDGSNVPPKLMEVFSEFNEDEDGYKEMERLRSKANKIGYDFSYGLDGTPTEFCEIPKKSWGGGIAIGTAVGGYVGYKIGRARTQKFGFETEKKIGKGIKNTFSRKKKMSQGGSFSSYFDGKLSFLNY
jgi:hypothetical protein